MSRPSVTSRALDVLGSFDEGHRVLTLTEISERSGQPLTTTHRLVSELVRWGALRRRPSGEYAIGRRLWRVGLLAPLESGLRHVAAPFLHDLATAMQATAQLAVRDDAETLYLDRVRGLETISTINEIGTRLPLHTTAVGKVLLAHAPAAVRERATARLAASTPHTVTDPTVLGTQLDRVLAEGFATTHQEMHLGAHSVAVGVRRHGAVVAAIGLVVAQPPAEHRLVAALQVAAAGIERALAPAHSPLTRTRSPHAGQSAG